jgi:porin
VIEGRTAVVGYKSNAYRDQGIVTEEERSMMMRRLEIAGLVVSFGMVLHAPVRAAETPPAPNYSGDVFSRSTLTGDWGGRRNEWAAKGVTFDSSVTQIGQGVVDGGKNGAWEYGGRGDLTVTVDTGKLGLWPGGFFTAELEGNWSNSVNGKTGALAPVNSNQLFPLPGGENVALPNLSVAQFLSHYAGVTLGKFQTITNGDMNEFAHGKGDTQFFNLAFNINPTVLAVPYSTLGAGLIVLPTADPNEAVVTAFILSASGKATTDGFSDTTGPIFAAEGRVRTGFCDRTGHQLVGGLYSNRQYTSLDQRLGFVIENQELAQHDGTWAVYYNFDQFLYETAQGSDKGIGLFGRFGASEGDPIPMEYFYSAGIGAKGLLSARPYDQFGIGYYYTSINNPTFQRPRVTTSRLRDEWGFEAYYNLALTPWLLVTPDIQVIGPAQKQQISIGQGQFGVPRINREPISNAAVLGFRLQVVL